MKLFPKSIYGWIWIFIFVFTQIATNSNQFRERLILGENFNVLFLDYLLFPIATGYLLFLIVANLLTLLKPKNHKSKTKLSRAELLEQELNKLKEIEKIKKLEEEIDERRKSLNLNSKEHFAAILRNIKSSKKKITELNKKYEKSTKNKKFYLLSIFIYSFIFFCFVYLFNSFDVIIYIVIFGLLIITYLIYTFNKEKSNQLFLLEKIKNEKTVLKDLEIEKKKNQI